MEDKESFELKTVFPVSAQVLYEHWLNGPKHEAMTGGAAKAEPKEGSTFEAWDGYIWGENLDLKPGEYLVQTWRTSEFAESDEDSLVSIHFKEEESGTELFLEHQNIPKGQTQYKQGWIDHYFEPMQEYFKDYSA